jgi:hypothetical protein
MTSSEALEAVRTVAARFGAGDADVREMWRGLNDNLWDLCQESPLSDDLQELSDALERWEIAIGSDRPAAIEEARLVAERVAENA